MCDSRLAGLPYSGDRRWPAHFEKGRKAMKPSALWQWAKVGVLTSALTLGCQHSRSSGTSGTSGCCSADCSSSCSSCASMLAPPELPETGAVTKTGHTSLEDQTPPAALPQAETGT